MKKVKGISRPVQVLLAVGVFLICSGNAVAQEGPQFEWAGLLAGNIGLDFKIAVDAAGNSYTTGSFNGTADFDPGAGVHNLTSAGSGDVFVCKLDKDGKFVWARAMGGTLYERPNNIATDAAGNVYTTGYFEGTADFDPGAGVFSFTAAQKDVFISKLDTDGNFVWAKQFGGPFFYENQAYAIAVDPSGNVYTTGFFKNTTDFDPGPGVFNISHTTGGGFVSKLDTDGNFVWAKAFTGEDGGIATGNSLALDADGNIYTTGMFGKTIDFDPGAGVFNLTSTTNYVYSSTYISKLDPNGNFVWAKSLSENYNGGVVFNEYGIATDASANVYLTSRFIGTQDFDPGAGTFNVTPVGKSDIYVLKLDSSGEFVWVRTIGSTEDDGGRSVATDAEGDVYFTGFFYDDIDVDPGSGTFNFTSSGILICKLDSEGDFAWAGEVKAGSYDKGTGLAVDGSGNVYTTGYFNSTGDFDPGPCTFNLTSSGSSDGFVLKLSQGTAAPGPTITSFSPTSGPVGTSVTITGTNFSATPANNVVTFFNNKTATVTASTSTSITTTVPVGAVTGKISVTVGCNTAVSATDFTVGAASLPTITSFTPASGPLGTV
ncbi:MAG TPA: SBBP repeat-containing protein, partial [Ohtaekwangia sp.]|nr:SBBP repeat-containing protein [Ohtaekwangia sp.]